MNNHDLEQRLQTALENVRILQDELKDTNSGMIALTAELEEKNERIGELVRQLWQTAKLATIGELAASIAHEMNNPLQTVSLQVESLMLRISSESPGYRELEVIGEEIERMGNLVGNLLEFSRKRQAHVSTVDLREEIDSTLELIYYHLRKRNIAVVQDYASQVPMIKADRQLMRQVFLNLFTNASDAMPDGGTLTIRMNYGGRLVIEIEDSGVGITPEDLPRIMEPFFSTKPEGKGTGLGLPICRRITEEVHGGTLQINSVVGKGTTVSVMLPMQNGMNGAFLTEGD